MVIHERPKRVRIPHSEQPYKPSSDRLIHWIMEVAKFEIVNVQGYIYYDLPEGWSTEVVGMGRGHHVITDIYDPEGNLRLTVNLFSFDDLYDHSLVDFSVIISE